MTGPVKRVSFPEEECTVVCEITRREDFSEEEQKALYFSKAEYCLNRQMGRRTSRDCERYGHSKCLEEAFAEKCSSIQDVLNHWCLNGHDRRGLERWANRNHGEKRQQDQFQAIMEILQAQDEMLMSGRVIDVEKIRKVSYKATKKSRHFARMMGKADAFAVESEELADSDVESIRTASTELTSTNISDDDISLPRMPNIDDDHSKHGMVTPLRKPKSLYNRLPSFLQRSKGRSGKETSDASSRASRSERRQRTTDRIASR